MKPPPQWDALVVKTALEKASEEVESITARSPNLDGSTDSNLCQKDSGLELQNEDQMSAGRGLEANTFLDMDRFS